MVIVNSGVKSMGLNKTEKTITYKEKFIRRMLEFCEERLCLLDKWDHDFISDLYERVFVFHNDPNNFTQKQFNCLQNIYQKIN